MSKETNPLLHLPDFVDALIEKIEKDQEDNIIPMPTNRKEDVIIAIKAWMSDATEIDWVWVSYLAMLGWLIEKEEQDGKKKQA